MPDFKFGAGSPFKTFFFLFLVVMAATNLPCNDNRSTALQFLLDSFKPLLWLSFFSPLMSAVICFILISALI